MGSVLKCVRSPGTVLLHTDGFVLLCVTVTY